MLALVTATRDSLTTLPDALASIECVSDRIKMFFVDGGSVDGTAEFLRSYAAANGNAVFQDQKGTGLYQALNQGVQAALDDPVTTHIGMLHSDDRLISNNYGDYLNFVESNQADIYYSDIEFHDSSENTVRIWKAGAFSICKLRTGWMPPHTGMIVAKSVYRDLGLYDPAFGTAADYEWSVRILLARSTSVAYFPKRIVSMRTGGASNVSIKARLRANAMDGRVWARRSKVHAALIRVLKPVRKVGQFVIAKGTK